MKKKTLVGLTLMIGFSALVLLSFGNQVGGYMDFTEAQTTGSSAHVVGTWVKEKHFEYDRQRNLFAFDMADEEGRVQRVIYPNPKPANFEDAEQVVVEGQFDGDVFVAEHILVKCPSKYNTPDGLEGPSV